MVPSCPPQRTSRVPSRDGPIPQISGCFLLPLTRLALSCPSSPSHWLRPVTSEEAHVLLLLPPPASYQQARLPLHRERLFAANRRTCLRASLSPWSWAPGAAPGRSPAWQPSRAQQAQAQPLKREKSKDVLAGGRAPETHPQANLKHNWPGTAQITANSSSSLSTSGKRLPLPETASRRHSPRDSEARLTQM